MDKKEFDNLRLMNGTPVAANENEQKHLQWPFYQDAAAYREQIRIGQIIKGSKKYPEPFTTASWSNEEIIAHAMQENVDQEHYIYAAAERMTELTGKIEHLELAIDELHKQLNTCKANEKGWKQKALNYDNAFTHVSFSRDEWKQEAQLAHDEIKKIVKERDEWKKKAVKLQMDVTDLEYKLSHGHQAHECNKNQMIVWDGEPEKHKIKAIYCRICSKILFGELVEKAE
jgi:predicted  nucleic acid-binding Zn-ribbon protein